jgi:hypothetical protein
VDPGEQLAEEDGSDSDDEPDSTGVVKSVTFSDDSTGVVKSVTFSDAIDLTVEEANADDAATSGGTCTHSAATSTATITRSGRVSRLPVKLGDYETNLSLMPEAFQGAATQANYVAHMLDLDVK